MSGMQAPPGLCRFAESEGTPRLWDEVVQIRAQLVQGDVIGWHKFRSALGISTREPTSQSAGRRTAAGWQESIGRPLGLALSVTYLHGRPVSSARNWSRADGQDGSGSFLAGMRELLSRAVF